MFRFLGPLILAAATGYVAYSNHDGDGSFLLLPYVEVLPWVEDSLQARGDATWQLLGGMAVVYVGVALWGYLRARGRVQQDEAELRDVERLQEWRDATPWKDVDSDDAP